MGVTSEDVVGTANAYLTKRRCGLGQPRPWQGLTRNTQLQGERVVTRRAIKLMACAVFCGELNPDPESATADFNDAGQAPACLD
jgi:hypothetical protein